MTEKSNPTLLQALGDKRMTAILMLGFASGLPLNLTGSTLQAWLTDVGLDIKTIGIFSLVGVPYIFKVLWAPMLDRYLPPLLGRRRGWIVIFQILLTVSIGALGFSSPAATPYLVGCIALWIAFLSASQDIVIDAYRVDIIPPEERALAAAATSFGYRTAAMLAGAFALVLAHHFGWTWAYGLVALLMAATLLATFWAPEPDMPARPPRTLQDAVIEPFRDLLRHKGAWGFLALILTYKVGDAFALSLYSTFMLKGMHFSLDELGIFGKVNMTVSTMIGTALGGWLYMRWGLFRSMLTFGVLQALTNLMYMVLALSGKVLWLMALATTIDTMAGGMGQAAFVAFVMAQCSPSFSATQYALLSALASVPRVLIGEIAAQVVSRIGWANFFIVTFLTALPGLVLLVVLRPRIADLENRDGMSLRA